MAGSTWQPAASLVRLAQRAQLLAKIRAFFAQRGVLEVETPVVCATIPAEPHIEPIPCHHPLLPSTTACLHTSPEAAMKRLLAAGMGDIYQICKVFRHGESGAWHNPEFTMLEWYRVGWDTRQLMHEVFLLVDEVMPLPPACHVTFQEAFLRWANLDPLTATADDLTYAAWQHGLMTSDGLGREELLDFLWTTLVEPGLREQGGAVFVRDFPASRAAMAEINPDVHPTAKRFELYVQGVELANGYQELTDPLEQTRRLKLANRRRMEENLLPLAMDVQFLAALEHGLPRSAGVALGVDRLVALACGASSIQEVMAFPVDRL